VSQILAPIPSGTTPWGHEPLWWYPTTVLAGGLTYNEVIIPRCSVNIIRPRIESAHMKAFDDLCASGFDQSLL
jgi:hypothetical protein